jgi:hypothetical protein
MVLGGLTPDGQDGTNPLTFLCLEAYRRNHMTNPVLTVRAHAGSPEDLLRRAAEVLRDGGGLPAIFNDDALIPAQERIGIPTADARDYTNDGCWETLIPGRTDFRFQRLSPALCLEWALNRGCSLLDGERRTIDRGLSVDGWKAPIANASQREMRPKSAPLRLEPHRHHTAFDPLRQGGEKRLRLDGKRDDPGVSRRGKDQRTAQLNRERRQRGDLFAHAIHQLGDGLAADVAEKAQRQVVALGTHPANALPSVRSAQATRQPRSRLARLFRQRHGKEGPQVLTHRDFRR